MRGHLLSVWRQDRPPPAPTPNPPAAFWEILLSKWNKEECQVSPTTPCLLLVGAKETIIAAAAVECMLAKIHAGKALHRLITALEHVHPPKQTLANTLLSSCNPSQTTTPTGMHACASCEPWRLHLQERLLRFQMKIDALMHYQC